MIAKKGIAFLLSIFLRLQQVSFWVLSWGIPTMALVTQTTNTWLPARHASTYPILPTLTHWLLFDFLAYA